MFYIRGWLNVLNRCVYHHELSSVRYLLKLFILLPKSSSIPSIIFFWIIIFSILVFFILSCKSYSNLLM